MKLVSVEEKEFKRAFDEALLSIEKSFRENPKEESELRFRTVNYHIRTLQSRLETG